MEPSKTTYYVMLNANEEAGLYEIPDDLLNALPTVSRADRVAAAKNVIAELVEAELLELWTAEWPRERVQPVTPSEILNMLQAETTWKSVSPNQVAYVFATLTPSGKAMWSTTEWPE
jgi:hypothetical protein